MNRRNDAVPGDGQCLLRECSVTFTEKENETRKNEIIEPHNEEKTRDDDRRPPKPDRSCEKVIKLLCLFNFQFLLSPA